MKRKFITWGIAAALIMSILGIMLLIPENKSSRFGIESGSVVFSEDGLDISDFVLGTQGFAAAENENFTLLLDGNANIILRHKESGKEWRAASENAVDPSKLSSLDISYYYENGKTELYSSDSAVDKKQVYITQIENGVKIEYIFGDMQEDFVFPQQISKERMEELLSEMSDEDAEYIGRRYTLYQIGLAEDADKDYLLNEYPRLAEEDLYILTDMPNQSVKVKTDEIFRSIGYTYEERDRDNSGAEENSQNPKAFRVAVEYTLTDTGFKAYINFEDALFYNDYPLTEIDLLPNFSAFSPGDSGYYMLPSGSGGLVYADNMANEQEINYFLPIYGQNSTVTRQLDSSDTVCCFPVYGQYKNGSAFLCILEKGEEQAELHLSRTASGMTLSPVWETIDNGVHQMQSKADTTMFASDVAVDEISAEYVMIPEAEEATAYSEMARIYRERLISEGVLGEKNSKEDPSLLVSVISSIEYSDLAAGIIPVKREYVMTGFSQTEEIAETLAKSIGAENLKVLLSGWNSNGLNAQKPGSMNISKAAGGDKGFKAMLQSLKSIGVEAFLNLEFVMVQPDRLFGYFPISSSARALNNSVVKLSVLDPVYCSWQETDKQLVAPDKYVNIWEKYGKNIPDSGIGVSQLTSLLCGNYANSELFTRSDTIESITSILSDMTESRSVLGNGGNLYALKYLSYVDSLSTGTDGQSFYEYDIPFVQMVIHGYVAYCGTESDRAVSEKSLLSLIETGSDLRRTVTANKFEKIHLTDFSTISGTCFEDQKQSIESEYERLKSALYGLADKVITEHLRINNEVVKVTYENGTCIYINYGKNDFNADGIIIPSEDFVRIDA